MNKERTEAYLSPSNSILFKRCRRKWYFQSRLGLNLEPKEAFSADAWFGTGIHFALEDYHGYNLFGNPIDAFEAYYNCFDQSTELNANCEALATMAPGILSYYVNEWLPKRKQFKTFYLNGVPQIEVKVDVELPQISKELGYPVHYTMRYDRMVEDEYSRLWVLDYKTAKRFDTSKLETDPQISAYSWGAELYYERPIEGMIYLQFKKTLIDDPKILKNGDISCDKTQGTNYYRYLEMLKFKFGSIDRVPQKNIECLDVLLSQESDLGDEFIRYDMVRRSDANKKNMYNSIRLETLDMLDPDLRLYANPTRDCYTDCLFRTVCMAMDDNMDYEFILKENYQERKEGEREKWKKKLVYPQK